MEPFQNCTDTSLITEISLPQQLYLKPEAKLNITVALPQVHLPGKTISNWEVMERLKQMIQPAEFISLRVTKSTLEFIRFDAEIESRNHLSNVISLLEGKSIKLSGFPELLKVKAAESKPDFPTRHDWDKYFRDAKNMNEMKPGERPDTIHIQGIPSKWFISKKDKRNGFETPNEFTLQKVFEIFGEIRCVDIPMLDPYRNQMKASISGIKKFSHSTDTTFDAFIQYKEYICFVKAMNALRGMKLVHWDGNKAFSASIKVDFDKTKHLSDMSIRKRKAEREKLIAKEREKEEEKRREEEAVRLAMEEENRRKLEEKELKGRRQKEREEKRKLKILKKLKKKEAEQMNIKIAIEERKLLMAQRKLESIRLLDELFERVKQEKHKEEDEEKKSVGVGEKTKRKDNEKQYKKKHEKDNKKKLVDKEKELRNKLVKKIKSAQVQQMEERREKLKKTIEGKLKLKSGLKGGEDAMDESDFIYNRQGDYECDIFPDYPGYEPFKGGYGYPEWSLRGFSRGFIPRRPFRSYRGSFNHYHGEWMHYGDRLDDKKSLGLEENKRKLEKVSPDGMEDISNNSSSDSITYSHLASSSENEDGKKSKDGKSSGRVSNDWPESEGFSKNDLDNASITHPWMGYPDYFHPRFARGGRGSRRPRGVYATRRGWPRTFPGSQINPNVPLNSFYMQSINSHYYKYFNKLAKGDYMDDYRKGNSRSRSRSKSKSRSRSRSRSHSSERVVCRKVLSRSRSRSRRYSRSRSKSRSRSSRSTRRPSKSKNRSKSKESVSRRDRSLSREKSRSRSRNSKRRKSESKEKSSKKKNLSGSRSKSKSIEKTKIDNLNNTEDEKFKSNVKEGVLQQNEKVKSDDAFQEEDKKNKGKKEEITPKKAKSEESDWSLSLSGSDEWSRGSPERKARPLGDPNWVPDRRERKGDRGYRTLMSKIAACNMHNESYRGGYERLRNRCGYRYEREEREPNLRSHISRPPGKNVEVYHEDGDSAFRDSKKSRHKRDKKRKRKYHEKDSNSKKKKRTGNAAD